MRTVTITYRLREGVTVPMIRLSGKWLDRAGFREGKRVQVQVENRRLTLILEDRPGHCRKT